MPGVDPVDTLKPQIQNRHCYPSAVLLAKGRPNLDPLLLNSYSDNGKGGYLYYFLWEDLLKSPAGALASLLGLAVGAPRQMAK